MPYIDGFLLPLPLDKVEEYRQQAETMGKIWMEYGALAYKECVGEDLTVPTDGPLPFPQVIGAKEGETVGFSYIFFKDRQHRDEVNAKVMADPRVHDACGGEHAFDFRRMAYGGFQTIVDL